MDHRSEHRPIGADALARAYRRLAAPGRPASVDAMLAHPLWRALLQGLARSLQRTEPVPQPRPTHYWPLRPRGRIAGPTVDFRRLAANDKDDD